MRGLLIIVSARAPYLRAGLSWSERAPLELHITELDGERLLALLADPVLTVSLEGDSGDVLLFPHVPAETTAEDMQMVIDRFAADAPPAPVAVLSVDDIVALLDIEDAALLPDRLAQLLASSEAWHADQRHLHDQGFQALEALTDAWAADRVALTDKTALLEAATADNAKLLADIAALREQLATVRSYTPATTEPALVIAQRLYGDPATLIERAEEIVARNKVAHPGFVTGGVALQVLSGEGTANG